MVTPSSKCPGGALTPRGRTPGGSPMPAPSSPTLATAEKPFREKVEKGIYKRRTRDGKTRYDYAYLDRDGKQRWGACAKLADAKRERAEKNGKPQAERVAPARELFADYAETWYVSKSVKLR